MAAAGGTRSSSFTFHLTYRSRGGSNKTFTCRPRWRRSVRRNYVKVHIFFFVSIANKRIGGGGGEYVRFEGSIRPRRRKEENKRERDSGSCNFRRGPTHSIRTGRKALQGEGERESSGCFGSNAKGPSRQRNERGRRVVFLSACYFLTDPSKTINDPKDKRERERGPSLLLLLLNFLLVFCCLLSFNGLQAAVCKNLTSVYCY